MGKAQDLSFGDLIIDDTCLFARRKGKTIQFTRSERALLLAFSRNPHRLMPRGQLLDAIASRESDVSDRNIDFLVNRLRAKLGDSARSPTYIATQYGEGYVWIAAPSAVPVATPSRTGLIDGCLAIAPAFASMDRRFSKQASALVGQMRDTIAAGVGAGREIVVVDGWRHVAVDRLRYLLQVSFQVYSGRIDCAATLRELPSKHIMRTFRLHLDNADATSFTSEATRVSHGVIDALRQALTDASTGLGTPTDQPLEIRLRKASTLLSSSSGWQRATY
jgi:DNA-binding winged helix-turn-helix (wHTH) protein